MDVADYTNKLNAFSVDKFQSHRIFCDRVLDFQPGQRGVISNGKVSVDFLQCTVSVYCICYILTAVVHVKCIRTVHSKQTDNARNEWSILSMNLIADLPHCSGVMGCRISAILFVYYSIYIMHKCLMKMSLFLRLCNITASQSMSNE